MNPERKPYALYTAAEWRQHLRASKALSYHDTEQEAWNAAVVHHEKHGAPSKPVFGVWSYTKANYRVIQTDR